MTAYIAQRVGGDLPFGEIGYLTIFAVGLYLFVITLALNLLVIRFYHLTGRRTDEKGR